MKIIGKLAICVLFVLLIGASMQPARGACTNSREIGTAGSYLVSLPTWYGAGGTHTCYWGYGCYGRPPISPTIWGSFWAFPGFGDPGPGGIDNGTWGVSNWTKSESIRIGFNTYFYPAFLTVPDGPYNGTAGTLPNWAMDARIDGCITDAFTPGQIDPQECTCILVTDEWDRKGYFAVLSSFTDFRGGFNIYPETTDAAGLRTIRMSALPQPTVVASSGTSDGMVFTVDPGTLDPTSLYTEGPCDCGIAYRVYYWRTTHTSPPFSMSRFCSESLQIFCWEEALAPDGGDQPTPPLFGSDPRTTVRVECDADVGEFVYVATRLVGDPASAGGFPAGHVSHNTFRTVCEAGPPPVSIDIKPDGHPNSVNPRSRGVIPVAILGSDTFDVSGIDVSSLRFGPGQAAPAHFHPSHVQDVNLDGNMDLVTHYRTQETGIACGNESATLIGETFDGQAIEGSDSILTVGCRATSRRELWYNRERAARPGTGDIKDLERK